jgi:hypothetical protein
MNRTKEEREILITEKVAIILMGEGSKLPSATVDVPQDTQSVDGTVDTTENLQKYQKKVTIY